MRYNMIKERDNYQHLNNKKLKIMISYPIEESRLKILMKMNMNRGIESI